MIIKTNTCVDPRTVVIESIHTLAARNAVPTSTSLYYLTIRAKRLSIESLKQLHELNAVVFDEAWVSASHQDMKNDS